MMSAAAGAASHHAGHDPARHRLVREFAGLVPGILYVYDIEHDRTLFVNTQVSQLLGWDDAEIGRLGDEIIRTLLHPDDAAALDVHLQALRRLGDGESRLARCRFRHADGTYRWFENRDAVLTRADDGRVLEIIGVSTDITERQAAEDALRENVSMARRKQARTELVASVMTELEALDALEPLMEGIVNSVVPRLADYAILEVPSRLEPILAITHFDPRLIPVLGAIRDRQRADGAAGTIVRATRGEAQLVAHVTPALLGEAARDEVTMALYRQLGPRSHVTVPVDVAGEAGALMLGLSDPGRRPYGSEELALTQEIAHRAGVLLARARIREEEHRIGVRLQRALLPEALLSDPAIEVAASYQTSSALLSVGGDWYDTLALPDGRLAFAVGDVVGHGLDAAAAMSRLRIALAALAPLTGSPGELLTRLGEFAAGVNGVEFATVAIGFYDPRVGRLSYASAGHPPVLVVSRTGATRWLMDGRSMPLGTVDGSDRRPEAHTELSTGDLLVFFSDGLVERRREPITTGLDRLAGAVTQVIDRPVREVCAELSSRALHGSVSEDDAVVLCVRVGRVSETRFERRIPALADQLAPTRTALRAWLARLDRSDSLAQRLLLATGEALSNAVEHAYGDGGTGAIDLTVADTGDGALAVTVSDDGRWSERESAPDRGRGLDVIATLGDDLRRISNEAGTTVSFRLAIMEDTP